MGLGIGLGKGKSIAMSTGIAMSRRKIIATSQRMGMGAAKRETVDIKEYLKSRNCNTKGASG